MQLLASIDVGTNTIRLWIGQIDTNKLHTLHIDRANVRLGERINHHGMIREKAAVRAVPILKRYKKALKDQGVNNYRAIGTSVFRKATNGKNVVDWLFERTGISIDVVSGKEEARLCVKGVLWDLPRSYNQVLVVDIGGGSTELILVQDYKIKALQSIDVGAVYLTEAYFKQDPPLKKEIERAKIYVTEKLTRSITLGSLRNILRGKRYKLIGTAGTATTLAAIDLGLRNYNPELVHGHVLNINKLLALFERLRLKKAGDRLCLPGLEPGREDIILAGLMIWIAVLRTFSCQEITISHNGILEGIAIDLWERNKGLCCTK